MPPLSTKDWNKAKYGWSKWGGANHGLVQTIDKNGWNCQACGKEQPGIMSPYFFEFQVREYIKICWMCHFKVLKKHILKFIKLKQLVNPD